MDLEFQVGCFLIWESGDDSKVSNVGYRLQMFGYYLFYRQYRCILKVTRGKKWERTLLQVKSWLNMPKRVYSLRLSDKEWTYEIKSIVGELGFENHKKVCASGFPDYFEREWLYDLVWYEEDNHGRLMKLPLVMESEWKTDYHAIKYDFEKLLQAKADLKVMVFQGHNIDDTFRRLHDAITAFKWLHSDDHFLSAGLDWENEEFKFYQYPFLSNSGLTSECRDTCAPSLATLYGSSYNSFDTSCFSGSSNSL